MIDDNAKSVAGDENVLQKEVCALKLHSCVMLEVRAFGPLAINGVSMRDLTP